jgi:hypothetical protein
MRWAGVFAAILFGIPLLTLLWLTVTDGKVLFIRNPNANPVSIRFATQNDDYTEVTDPRSVAAGALTWIIFNPQIKGDSGLLCTGLRGATRTALATAAKPLPMFSKVTLGSCEGSYVLRMIRTPHPSVRRHIVTPPQPL